MLQYTINLIKFVEIILAGWVWDSLRKGCLLWQPVPRPKLVDELYPLPHHDTASGLEELEFERGKI